MRRIYDITSKLTFAEPPVIKVRDIELTVNDSATNTIQLMSIMGNGENIATDDIYKCAELLYGKDGVKKLEKLKLNFTDFTTVILESANLIVGGEEQGEAEEMPAMT